MPVTIPTMWAVLQTKAIIRSSFQSMHTSITLPLCQHYQWIVWLITVMHRGQLKKNQEGLSKALGDAQIIFSMKLLEELWEQREREREREHTLSFAMGIIQQDGEALRLVKAWQAIFLVRPFLPWPLGNLAGVRSWAICKGSIPRLRSCCQLTGPFLQPGALGSRPKCSIPGPS